MFVSLPNIINVRIWKLFIATRAHWFTKVFIITLCITNTEGLCPEFALYHSLPLPGAGVAIVGWSTFAGLERWNGMVEWNGGIAASVNPRFAHAQYAAQLV